MGRKSLAEQYYEETSKEEDSSVATWIVLYDFRGVKPNPRFWKNVNRLIGMIGGSSMVQYSVFMTGSRRGAIAAVKLARHYKADVVVFRGEEVDFEV